MGYTFTPPPNTKGPQGTTWDITAEAEELLARCDGSSSWYEEWTAMEARLAAAEAADGGCFPVTLHFPAGLKGLGVPVGRWRQPETGEIEATYETREELALGLAAAGPHSER